ncbi:MAG TPA: DeoR/GlpR family DNA-binding transcription regulator [Rectinemataceae bacterium]|nr:DeoR/GlpR family DNA-binding transcription regulator [Rectinemataceae bacterium]
MFAVERINIIRSYLREHGKLDVHSISEMLNVSEVTVRRDLEKLETEGFLQRLHGGAILVEQDEEPERQNVSEEELREEEEREEIARIALLMVKDNDVIMLTNGEIVRILARKLAARTGVTVLTNDIPVALEIAGQATNKAVLLGGSPEAESSALFGSLTETTVQKFFVNKIFVEVDGISEQLQMTVTSQEKAALIKEAMTCADEKIALCEAGHFSRNAFYRLGPLTMVAKVVTNISIPERYKSGIFAENIQLFTSVNAFEGSEEA